MPTQLKQPSENPTHPSRPVSGIDLKVTQAGHVIQQATLPIGKCTIGSSPSCQIRITTGQLKPLQCVIIHESNQITVTRWGAGVLLNGVEFATAPLQLGDRLAIGDVQLQLVNSAESPSESEVHFCPVALLDRVEAQVAAEVSPASLETRPVATCPAQAEIAAPPEQRQQSDALELARLQAAKDQARQRARRFVGTLRDLRSETRGLDQHVRTLSEQLHAAQQLQEHLTAELYQSQAIAAERAAQFGEELDRAIAELSASYERANAAEQDLHAAQESFQSLQAQLDSLSAECEQLRQAEGLHTAEAMQFKSLLEERETEIARLREELASVQQTLVATQHELQLHHQDLQKQLADASADHERQITSYRQEFEQAQAAAHAELEQCSQTYQNELASAASAHDQQVAELHNQLCAAEEVARDALARLEAPNPLVGELESELSDLRIERQDLATENHRLSQQLVESEKRVELLEIDVHSITSEWQQAHNTATQLQEARSVAEAHVADLTAKMSDLECAAAVEWSVECDRISAQLVEAREHLATQEQALTETLAERDQFAAQLAAVHEELAQRQQELADAHRQLTDLQAQLTRTEKEQTRLAAELTVRDEQASELIQKAQATEQRATRELESRDQRIKDLIQEIQHIRDQATENLRERDAQLTQLAAELAEAQNTTTLSTHERDAQIVELTNELTQIQQKALAEIDAQQARINELATQLSTTREQYAEGCQTRDAQILELRQAHEQAVSDLAQRDTKISELVEGLAQAQQHLLQGASTNDAQAVELAEKLKNAEEHASLEIAAQSVRINELARELEVSQEQFTVKLNDRELHIAELAQELKQTQDQLTDCAAQGERLHELYQQAQIDLAALQASAASAVSLESRGSATNELPPTRISPSDDPRDDDEPRLVRALASAASESTMEQDAASAPQSENSSFIDRYSHLFDEEADTSATLPITPAAPAATPAGEDLEHLDMHDDAALEAYMANMMRRVRGETSSETITPPLAKTAESETGTTFSNPITRMQSLTQRVSTPELDESELTVEESLIDLQTLKETSQKPPLPTSFSAMRELANLSARQAIAKHRKRRHLEGALGKLLVSVVTGVTATYILFTAESFTSPYFLAGCAVAIVSGLWGIKLIGVFLEMIRDGINNEFTPAELQSIEEALPIDGAPDHAASVAH